MNKKLAVMALVFLILNLYSCGSKKAVTDNTADAYPYVEVAEPSRTELIMKSLAQAYPDRISKIEFRDDDWALLLRDKWYFYAGGRLLPENQLENAANFRTNQFYSYPKDLPEWQKPSEEETTRYSSWTTARSQNQIRRSNFFLDDLWQASTRAETESRLTRITFLGKATRVHNLIKDNMSQIETKIRAAASNDQSVQTWINSINTLEGYGWRNIADTQSRSYHSYGLAIDLLPRNLGGRQTYWLWTSHHKADWWNVSYSQRYHPPEIVIKIFEEHGFVWGGKWPLFDTMHFEYRPEILIFNGLM